MGIVEIICGVLVIIAAVIVMVCTTMMEPTSSGLGSLAGDTNNFFGKNANRTKQAMLKRTTWIMGTVIVICTLVILFITK